MSKKDKILLGQYKEIVISYIFLMRLSNKDFKTLDENNIIIHSLNHTFILKGKNAIWTM